MDPRDVKRMRRVLVLALPPFVFAFDFVRIFVTYLVLPSIATNVMGEVAAIPAVFAGWIALVALPIRLAGVLAVGGQALLATMTNGVVADPPDRKGWRRILVKVRDDAIDVVETVAAALIVFHGVVDPGVAEVWQLAAVTAVGSFLVPKSIRGLFRLLRWWWRTRHGYRPRHSAPDSDQQPVQTPGQPASPDLHYE